MLERDAQTSARSNRVAGVDGGWQEIWATEFGRSLADDVVAQGEPLLNNHGTDVCFCFKYLINRAAIDSYLYEIGWYQNYHAILVCNWSGSLQLLVSLQHASPASEMYWHVPGCSQRSAAQFAPACTYGD